MSLSIKILGCNGECRSCYENRIRSVYKDIDYDIEAILRTINEYYKKSSNSNPLCLHGGEPLMMKKEDIEKILQECYSLWGSANIQTNGVLISNEYIKMFKKYNVSIGVSIDGDTWELNQGRWNMKKIDPVKIQKMTDLVLSNIKKCKDAGLSVAIIVLLRRYNAIGDRLSELIKFLLRLKSEFGICSIRTNECIVYEKKYKKEEELTSKELGEAYCKIADVALSDEKLYWLPYRDIVDLLLGYGNGTCVFTRCDVWKTISEQPIDKDGNIGNCLKGGGAIDGIQVVAANTLSDERYKILSQVPQELGGCKDCRYWYICYGLCPGEGINNDWRNKGRFCESWKMLFKHIEKKLKGLMPNLYTVADMYPKEPEVSLIQSTVSKSTWKGSFKKNLETLKNSINEKVGERVSLNGHGDRPHGDSGHGDSSHGDSGHGDRAHGDRAHGDA